MNLLRGIDEILITTIFQLSTAEIQQLILATLSVMFHLI